VNRYRRASKRVLPWLALAMAALTLFPGTAHAYVDRPREASFSKSSRQAFLVLLLRLSTGAQRRLAQSGVCSAEANSDSVVESS
jgi:hypothetical protein